MMAATSRLRPLARWRWFSYERSRISPRRLKKDGATERILLLAFVEADVAAAPQFRVLQPVQREQRSLELSELAQRERQAVLPRIGRELAQDDGCRDGAGFDRHSNRKISCQWSWMRSS